ncbi:hypothetical protein [Sphingosinicella sp. BN140058]|uniref:hypothetical protein n=1 Tax=Sphingosinicella sp. BN140058 TaxID=1892855 RepID=UPI001010E05C|nr:hypothetical protein [Sphingosinicella sp. BN140058]QAY80198.1 hypothetical protein ETR14_26510 [Sphingosinicella sp. BN140058]
MRRYGAIAVLVALYWVAAQLGETFGSTLFIMSVFFWTLAAGMFVFLVLFRGLTLRLFSKPAAEPEDDVLEEQGGGEFGDDGEDRGRVVALPASPR